MSDSITCTLYIERKRKSAENNKNKWNYFNGILRIAVKKFYNVNTYSPFVIYNLYMKLYNISFLTETDGFAVGSHISNNRK